MDQPSTWRDTSGYIQNETVIAGPINDVYCDILTSTPSPLRPETHRWLTRLSEKPDA